MIDDRWQQWPEGLCDRRPGNGTLTVYYVYDRSNDPSQIGGGHGPSTPGRVGRAFMVVLGIFFAIVALSPGVRVRGAFSRGSGESVPVNTAGRVILLIVAGRIRDRRRTSHLSMKPVWDVRRFRTQVLGLGLANTFLRLE
jgi:hypothetical protein